MTQAKQSILIVDDEPAQRQLLSGSLGKDYAVITAADGAEAVQLLSRRSFDLVIADERMPRMSGIELIKWVRERSPETPVIVLTAYGAVETAAEAIKLGAEEYLTKPLKNLDELRWVVGKALRQRALRDRNLLHQAETDLQFPADIIARSKEMQTVLKLADQVAAQSTTVLLTGESGTGKEVVARFTHRRSTRCDGPFVAVNCAALTESLLESELFGNEKGAFTGATQSRRGRFELAHRGTLFLDEVGEMGVNLQVKLLRVLQEQLFERVGGGRTLMVDVRVIAATNRDLHQALQAGTFREDLFYRLNLFPIPIPPLRERREDILPLAEHFARQSAKRMGRSFTGINVEAASILYEYGWPGNVRELANAVERALIVAGNDVIRPGDLPLRPAGQPAGMARAVPLATIEKAAIVESLARNDGDRRRTADELGISLRTLQYRLKDYGMIKKE
jgi:DNA-binding NtrC family response regulator